MRETQNWFQNLNRSKTHLVICVSVRDKILRKPKYFVFHLTLTAVFSKSQAVLFVCLFVVTFKLSYKTGANIMQIGALFASRQPISSNPGAVLWPRLSNINITPDATVIRITVPIPSADWLYTKPIHTAMDIDAITFKDTRSSSHTARASDVVHKGHTLAVYIRARVRWNRRWAQYVNSSDILTLQANFRLIP